MTDDSDDNEGGVVCWVRGGSLCDPPYALPGLDEGLLRTRGRPSLRGDGLTYPGPE